MILFASIMLVMFVRTGAMDAQQAQNFVKVCNWLDQPPHLFENMLVDPPVAINNEDSYSVSEWSYYWHGGPKNGDTTEIWMYREDGREHD